MITMKIDTGWRNYALAHALKNWDDADELIFYN